MFKKNIIILFLFFYILIQNSSAFEIHPFIGLKKLGYDDNIYLTPGKKKSSFVTIISPGIDLIIPTRLHQFTFSTFSDLIFYSYEPAINNKQDLTVKFDLDSTIRKYIKLNLGDSYQNISDPATSELTQREKRTQNTASIGIGFPVLRKLGAYFFLNSTRHDYVSSSYASYNRLENFGGIKLLYLLSKTSLLLEYNASSINYNNGINNSTLDQVEVGIERKMTARLTTVIKFGQETRKYNSRPSPKPFSIMTVQAEEKLSSTTLFRILAEKRAYESTTYANNPYFDSIGGTVDIEQNAGKKIVLLFGVNARTNNYPVNITESGVTKKRTDTLLYLKLGLRYKMHKYLSLRIAILNKRRDSTFTAWNYKNTQIETGVNLLF